MEIEFWFDPLCPWCWVTARWVVDEVEPARDLDITWQPMSLLFKNDPDPDSDYYTSSRFTHGLLRVIESVRAVEGDDAVFRLYWEFGSRIHHDDDRDFAPAEALAAAGCDTARAEAFDDPGWDAEIRSRMDAGLALCGDDVGTPIIAFKGRDGVKRGLFGPVLSRVPPHGDSIMLWDALVSIAGIDGFWELKRTRTERPQPGVRPRAVHP